MSKQIIREKKIKIRNRIIEVNWLASEYLEILRSDFITELFKLYVIFTILNLTRMRIEKIQLLSPRIKDVISDFRTEYEKYLDKILKSYPYERQKEIDKIFYEDQSDVKPSSSLGPLALVQCPSPFQRCANNTIIYSPKGIRQLLNTAIEKLKKYMDDRNFNSISTELKEEERFIYGTDLIPNSRGYKDRVEHFWDSDITKYRYYKKRYLRDQPKPNYLSFWGRIFSYSKTQKIEAAQALVNVLEARRDGNPIPTITQKQWAVLNQGCLGEIVYTLRNVINSEKTSLDIQNEIKEHLPDTLSEIVMEYHV